MDIDTGNLHDLITFVQGFLDCESDKMESQDILSVGSMNDKLISIMMNLNSGSPVLLTSKEISNQQAKAEERERVLGIVEEMIEHAQNMQDRGRAGAEVGKLYLTELKIKLEATIDE